MPHSRFLASLERLPEFDDHKVVTFFYDKDSGLKAWVAIHNDNLGPATGGTRMWVYKNEIDALRDALNLSRAMTYKCALAGVKYGGSKGVIIGNPEKNKTPELLRAYASAFNNLRGVTTGTDVGLTDEDVQVMSVVSPFILGKPNQGKLSTSKMASLGVFYSILGCFEEVHMTKNLEGKRFAVKGLGKTGMELVRLLHKEGAKLVVAEIEKDKIKAAQKEFPDIEVTSPKTIHKEKVDMYCPCALGGDLTLKTIKELKCQFVCGSANNQLEGPEVGKALYARGIVYAPDYVANAGGLINVVDELERGGYRKDRVLERVAAVKRTMRKIIARSQKEKQPTSWIADRMAEDIFTKRRSR